MFLTSELVEGEWSASLQGYFTHEKTAPLYTLDRSLDVPQSHSEWLGEKKNLAPAGTQAVSWDFQPVVRILKQDGIMELSSSGTILRYYFSINLERQRKSMKSHGQNS
jgi:hypothetical protein